ncbi:uncharacterized protein LOC134827553 isoform X5 [Culicoides brevitarsis]|uniref:uncharacterized protein LOC134827553 isoform X5 n=1 Tax=Culicoides brevitarsis TaxID=469753 RepID=UPI00307C73D1
MSRSMGPNSDNLESEATTDTNNDRNTNEKTSETQNCDTKKAKSDEKTTKLKPPIAECDECDEVLTVILSEETVPNDLTIVEDEKIEKIDDPQQSQATQKTFPKSILANGASNVVDTAENKPVEVEKARASFRKKSVSFENDEAIRKFTGGEEIVDQENPFKPQITSETGVNYKFIKKNKLSKKSSIPAALPQAQVVRAVIKDSDYITKEEILRQSKYVPVYVKNPDRVLTYDKSIIDRLSGVESEVEEPPTPRIKKIPIPAPRKISKLPALTASAIIGKRDTNKKRHFLKPKNKGNYPDLSDIKVKTGTDWEESLYDPNEVAINVIKFDSLLKKKKYKSEEDSDETPDLNGETSSNEENPAESASKSDEVDSKKSNNSDQKANNKEKDDDSSGKGSYTNTVTSSEFREFLRKKGLTLVPNTLRIQAINNKAKSETTNGVGPKAIIAEMEKSGEKKSSILRRLFQGNLFSSRKTSPKAPIPQPQVFAKANGVTSDKEIARKRLPNGKSSVLADNEFTKHFNNKERLSKKHSYEDDRGSSISSMLTAAEDYLDMQPGSPKSPRSNYLDMLPGSLRKSNRATSDLIQRSSEINKAKSAMLKSRPAVRSQSAQSFKVSSRLSQPLTFEKSSPQPGDGVLKPKVQRPMANGSAGKQKPPVPVRTVSDRALNNKQQALNKENNVRMNRSYSMDRDEIRLRSKPPQPLERTSMKNTGSKPLPKQSNVEAQLNRLVQLNGSPERASEGPAKTSTPKTNHQLPSDAVTPMTKDRRVISPVAAKEKTPEIDPFLYVKLAELKKKTDEELLNKASQNNSVFPKTIYGPKSAQRAPENIYQQPVSLPNGNFVRNSPQRSTVTGVVRAQNGPLKDEPRLNSGNYGYVNGNVAQNQPARSQSVLDGMTGSPMYGSMRYRMSNNSTPVQLRKGGTLDRKHILNQIYEFYRRSVNNTPTSKMSEEQLYSRPNSVKNVSPNSYASVRVHQAPPEVRQRAQSVQQQPIYGNRNAINAAIYAQARSISQSVPTGNAQQATQQRISSATSDNDSVFLPPQPPTAYKSLQKAPQQPFVIRESEQITPWDVLKYRSVPNTPQREQIYATPHKNQPIYGKVYDTNAPKMQRRPASVTPYNGQPAYQPSQPNGRVRLGIDGRSTPLILSSNTQQQQQQQSPMKSAYVEPMYRPIQMNRRAVPQSPLVMQQNHAYNRNSATGSQEFNKNLRLSVPYESDTGSEAGEIQRILYNRQNEEDWQNDKSNRNQQNEQVVDDRRRARSREDPRRHTLGNEMLHYANQQQGIPMQRSMDLEQPPQMRGYMPSNQGPLFDDDPGIMSEVETSSTGFRRGGKQRSSLPVVRTPSQTLERPLGLVFLQYRNETKRALLPNEITSIDTVRALFVRSFPRQLSMAYLEGPNVKIYIHDSSKDMFYELEDVSLRSHLREIKDRSVLRLFESTEVGAPAMLPGGPNVPQPLPQTGGGGHYDMDPSYFSEPEFDSEYQHQHIHKSKSGKNAPYYVGAAQTLPRGMYSDRNKNSVGMPAKPIRSYGSRGSLGPQYPYTQDQLYSIPDGYMSSPERGTRSYEEPYYSQYGSRQANATPIIDEEQNEQQLVDDQYALYGVKTTGRIPRNVNQLYDPTRPEDLHRIRVEHMERQLANLTGLVQKALTQNPQVAQNYLATAPNQQYRTANGTGEELYVREKPPKLGKASCHKSVSFEKSVSFSDDIQGVPKSHNPVDSKPPKPAIKSSTLPRMSSQERTLKPAPPAKGLNFAVNQYPAHLTLAPEVYNHLRGLQKKAKELRTEVRTLRRLAQTQAMAVREDIKDSFIRIRATLLAGGGNLWGQGDQERKRLTKEEELYKQEVIRLETDLGNLESSVEGLRTEVINRRSRVNMSSVEDMALVLSRASKTVAELKMKFPELQAELRAYLANEMEHVCREETFLKDEPDRLESALRRCKKLTGTLVTLKRLASVQEQRLPNAEPQPGEETPRGNDVSQTNKPIPSPRMGQVSVGGIAPENALDALLDELQTFAKPMNNESRPDDSTSDDSSQTLQNSVTLKVTQSTLYPQDAMSSNIGLRRLHSYPSGSDTDTSPPQPSRIPAGKPPVPDRNPELLAKANKKQPPPPPPRTSSRSPLASPTSASQPNRLSGGDDHDSGSESAGSQDNSQRQMQLEMRHQELLKKQKQLQEQYQRLQQLSKNAIPLAPSDPNIALKKTGSESNLPQKMGLNMSISGSMKNLSDTFTYLNNGNGNGIEQNGTAAPTGGNATSGTTTKQVYETEIL